MATKKKKTLKGLAAYMKKHATGSNLDQGVGAAFKQMDESGNGTAKAVNACGRCVGAHLADWFETKYYKQSLNEDKELSWYINDNNDVLYKIPSDRVLEFRHFRDGASALFSLLWRSKDFRDFANENSWHASDASFDWDTDERVDAVAYLLREKCGAPESCFSWHKWPDDTPPYKVFKELEKLYPRLAV